MATDVEKVRGFIRIHNPDKPVYRIYPLWFFEEALRLRNLVLVRPRCWTDPFEWLPDGVRIDYSGPPFSTEIEQGFVDLAFGQCWSWTSECDVLWKAYSRVLQYPHTKRNIYPRDEGVQVRSTPRKLLDALCRWGSAEHCGGCFVGAVRYIRDDEINQFVVNDVVRRGNHAFSEAELRAQLLLLKRTAFQHEAEVRLICMAQRDGVSSSEDLIRIPIDPNSVFEEVALDPRLAAFECKEHLQTARMLGYQGPVRDSSLYIPRLLHVTIPGTRAGGAK